ncbi:MAG TPA: ATP-binding protein [Magnetospirillum sp.]|nr:ATP-binding protein [Magnetospirillum sp.]
MPDLHLSVASALPEVRRVISAVEAFGKANDLPLGPLAHLRLALDEFLTNAVTYGAAGGNGHKIEVDVTLEGHMVTVTIVDRAPPFNPLDVPPPDLSLELDDRPIGGLGIHLARGVMDEVLYRRDGDRNILTLRKSLVAKAARS